MAESSLREEMTAAIYPHLGQNRKDRVRKRGSGLDIWVNFGMNQSWGKGQEGRGGVKGREGADLGWGGLGQVGLWSGPQRGGEASGGWSSVQAKCELPGQSSRAAPGRRGAGSRWPGARRSAWALPAGVLARFLP